MSRFNLAGLTFNSNEVAKDVSKAIFERYITGGSVAEHHEIMTGVSHDEQIVFVGPLAEIGEALTGCGQASTGQLIPLTQKIAAPRLIGGRLDHCINDSNRLFQLFKKERAKATDFFDGLESEELGVITAAMGSALERAINRLVWFGDTAANTIAGGGVFANGTTLSLYTPFNGLFRQIFTEVTGTNRVTITENAGTTYALQALPANAAIAYLRAMFNSQMAVMHQARAAGASLRFYCTRAFAQNYADTLEDRSLAFTLQTAEQGSTGINYRGVPIIIRDDWDAYINLQNNGTRRNLPHRAILTFKENIPVYTLSEGDLSEVTSHYDETLEINIMRFKLFLGTLLLEQNLTVAAY